MSHEHDNDDDKGKARIIGRPTVEVPMTEATGRAIIKKLDELSDQMTMVVTSIMDLEQQARVTGLDGEAGEQANRRRLEP